MPAVTGQIEHTKKRAAIDPLDLGQIFLVDQIGPNRIRVSDTSIDDVKVSVM